MSLYGNTFGSLALISLKHFKDVSHDCLFILEDFLFWAMFLINNITMANIIVSGHPTSGINGTYIDQGNNTWRLVTGADPSGYADIAFLAGVWRIEGGAAWSIASGPGSTDSGSNPWELTWSNNVVMTLEVLPSVDITVQPVSLTAVPGQDVTFSVTATANFSPVTFAYRWSNAATTQSITIDPLMSDNGNTYSVSVSALSAGVLQATTTSLTATLTVQEDVAPFDVYDLGPETGRERHRRLHLLGYI
jgi:hypothetical protein